SAASSTIPTVPCSLFSPARRIPPTTRARPCCNEFTGSRGTTTSKDGWAVLEAYDINLGRHLLQGVDVWLNNPRRPLEASGTSGQKVVLNGGLNCSILDGWWAEAYDGKNGFAIGYGAQHVDPNKSDERDAAYL